MARWPYKIFCNWVDGKWKTHTTSDDPKWEYEAEAIGDLIICRKVPKKCKAHERGEDA